VSKKEKRAGRLALRHFFTGVPRTLDQAVTSFDRLVWLFGLALVLALVALVGHWLTGGHRRPPPPEPGEGTLYVRDLGRLPDGRHQFDLVYAWQHRGPAPQTVVRLSLGDVAAIGDSAELLPAPGPFDDKPRPGVVAWHVLQNRDTRDDRVHYRLVARADQLADVSATTVLPPPPRWFGHGEQVVQRIGDELQLAAVLRAHCPLGVKVHNGSVTPLCGP
jgi:hypothetical protein